MPPPIRIAHVNVARGYRGGERQTELLIRELAARGFDQVLVARRRGQLLSRFDDVPLEIRPTSGNLFHVFTATRRVDVVHVHEGRSPYPAWLRSFVSGTPYILTRRVDNPIRDHRLAHLAYRRAASVAAISPAVADSVREFEQDAPVTVVADSRSALPVDANRVAEIRRCHAGKFVVGHIAALDNAVKGQEHVIGVAAALDRSHPDVQFMLIGGGPDEAMLKASASDLGNVEFTGFVDNVGDYLAALDVLVLPSNREGLGSILLDAMWQHVPVIGSRVGGIPWLIRDGETGLLIDAGRRDQLKAAILRLRDAPELRADLARNGRKLAEQHTVPVMADHYIHLYRCALGYSPVRAL